MKDAITVLALFILFFAAPIAVETAGSILGILIGVFLLLLFPIFAWVSYKNLNDETRTNSDTGTTTD
jgi:hypothetical protein